MENPEGFSFVEEGLVTQPVLGTWNRQERPNQAEIKRKFIKKNKKKDRRRILRILFRGRAVSAGTAVVSKTLGHTRKKRGINERFIEKKEGRKEDKTENLEGLDPRKKARNRCRRHHLGNLGTDEKGLIRQKPTGNSRRRKEEGES